MVGQHRVAEEPPSRYTRFYIPGRLGGWIGVSAARPPERPNPVHKKAMLDPPPPPTYHPSSPLRLQPDRQNLIITLALCANLNLLLCRTEQNFIFMDPFLSYFIFLPIDPFIRRIACKVPPFPTNQARLTHSTDPGQVHVNRKEQTHQTSPQPIPSTTHHGREEERTRKAPGYAPGGLQTTAGGQSVRSVHIPARHHCAKSLRLGRRPATLEFALFWGPTNFEIVLNPSLSHRCVPATWT